MTESPDALPGAGPRQLTSGLPREQPAGREGVGRFCKRHKQRPLAEPYCFPEMQYCISAGVRLGPRHADAPMGWKKASILLPVILSAKSSCGSMKREI